MNVTVDKPEEKTESIIPPASMGLLDRVKLIVAKNPQSVHERHDINGFSALHYAARIGHGAMAQFLISSGADVYAADFRGRWPVDISYAIGNYDVIEVIERATYPENRETRFDVYGDDDDGPKITPFPSKPKP
jgi:ankyrin repeat protein